MYVIDKQLERVAEMKGKTLAEFLNVVIKHEIGDFCFAATEQEAGNIILSLMKEKKKIKSKVKLDIEEVQTYLSAVWQEAKNHKEKTKGSITELTIIQQLILAELLLHQTKDNKNPMTLSQIRTKHNISHHLSSKNCLALQKGYPRSGKFTEGRRYVKQKRLGRTNTLTITPEGIEALTKIYKEKNNARHTKI